MGFINKKALDKGIFFFLNFLIVKKVYTILVFGRKKLNQNMQAGIAAGAPVCC